MLTAVLLLTSFLTIVAASSITVWNSCDYEVRCMVVNGATPGSNPAGPTFDAFTAITPEGYHVQPIDELGQTIICGKPADLAANLDKCIQLEFTHSSSQNQFSWDVLVFVADVTGGQPFYADGFLVTNENTGIDLSNPPSDFSTCRNAICYAGQGCPADQAYTAKDDDPAMRACPLSDDLQWVLCPFRGQMLGNKFWNKPQMSSAKFRMN